MIAATGATTWRHFLRNMETLSAEHGDGYCGIGGHDLRNMETLSAEMEHVAGQPALGYTP
jgi:hypothetical protein